MAARSRTYFWRERADAAVDYGLGWTDVRGGSCFGHGGGFVLWCWVESKEKAAVDEIVRVAVSLAVTMEGHFGLLLGGVTAKAAPSAFRLHLSGLEPSDYLTK